MTSSSPVPLERVAERLRRAGLLVEVRGTEGVAVSGVSQDSREVGAGDLFLAWKGTAHDAHDFVPQAVEAGCRAVVAERPVEGVDVPLVLARDGRAGAALAADEVMGSPWRDLRLVGVTGTNGKTTTALLTRHLMAGAGPAAAVGTLGVVDASGRVRPGTEGLTTPGPVEVARRLRDLRDEGMETVVMETSSHALEQRRLDGCGFRAGIFTNLGHDHLDYHRSVAEYRHAKVHLTGLLLDDGGAAVNGEDPAWEVLPLESHRILRFHDRGDEDEGGGAAGIGERLVATGVRTGGEGATFRLHLRRGGKEEATDARLPLLGRFNVENALAAAAAALVLGRPLDEAAARLASAPQVPGRMEAVVRRPFTVLVDFAHAPDALARALETVRPLFPGRVIVVFGAGGDRDPSKRAPMGRIAARHADIPIVTSDNPRNEDPEAIIDQIEQGMAGVEHHRVSDRREAIERALSLAREGDVVLLAGKGHERYEEVEGRKRPFDEREIVRGLLGGRGADIREVDR